MKAMKTADAIRALAALAQESRLRIYRLLVQQGPAGIAAGTISERMDIAGATLSFHLKELTQAGLVTPRQDGRFIYYSANYPAMNQLLDYLTENCCQGGDCVSDGASNARARRAIARNA